MQIIDLTPTNRVIPPISVWRTEITQLNMRDHAVEFQAQIDDIIAKAFLSRRIDANILTGKSKFAADIHSFDRKCSLVRKVELDANISNPDEWMSLWEVYNNTIFPYYSRLLDNKIQQKTEKLRSINPDTIAKGQIRDYKLRTFHIADNTGNASDTMGKVIHRVTYSTSVPIQHDWLANHWADHRPDNFIKNKTHWVVGADSSGAANVSNMRSWKNKITIDLKKLDIVTSSATDHGGATAAMIFALMNLDAGGCAIISVPNFSETRITSITHLFSNCFDVTQIYHTMSDDSMYICGMGFLTGNIASKHTKLLFDYLSLMDAEASLFASRWYDNDGPTQLAQRLVQAQDMIFKGRVDRYAKIIDLYNKLNSSRAISTFENAAQTLINEAFPDQSAQWAHETGLDQIMECEFMPK